MKKSSILLLSALALGVFTACDDEPAKAVPQHNEQEPLFTSADVAASVSGPIATGALTLQDYNAEEAVIPVMTVEKAEGMPAGAVVSFALEVASNPEFTGSSKITAPVTDGTAYIDASTLNTIHVALFGKSPSPKTVYYRVPGYVSLDKMDYRIESPDKYYASGSYEETCFDMGFSISQNYYLLGNATTWDLAAAAAYPFSHSSKDVYDDPVFTIIFEVSDEVIASSGGCYWKIASQEAIDKNSWDYTVGVATDGDTAMEGMLVTDNVQAGKIEAAGKYKMVIDMESMHYTIEMQNRPDYLAVPNNANGWTFANTLFYGENHGCFYGVANMDLIYGFKFGYIKGGNQVWCGAADEAGYFTDGAGGNILEGETAYNGACWLTANTDTWQYTIAHIDNISIIGLNGDWNGDIDLTPDATNTIWTATVNVTKSTDWKFRINHAWTYDLGGPLDDLQWGTGNCPNSTEGRYTYTLDLSKLPYTCSVVPAK